MVKNPFASVLGLVASLMLGCVGVATDEATPPTPARANPTPGTSPAPANPTPGASPAPTTPGPLTPPPGTPAGARAPLRRLSHLEYNNTVRDLLGDKTRPADRFLSDEAPGSFSNAAAAAQVSPLVTEQYRSGAEKLAADALKNLATLVTCKPADAPAEEACARTFIEDFGQRAFRRPLAADEAMALLAVFRINRAEGDFGNGIVSLIETVLQAPSFLYRVELPPAGAARGTVTPLGPYEMASRLSYFLTATMPDKELFAAAKAGKLGTPAEVQDQARRLIRAAGGPVAISEFFRQWLALHELEDMAKDRKALPDFSEDARRGMRDETLQFTRTLMTEGDGKLATLLTSSSSFVNAALGKIYGVAGPAMGMGPVTLDPAQRAGILTQASILSLTAHAGATSPTRRGKFVREQFMCQPPPPPPADVETTLPKPMAGQTAREIYREHAKNPACNGCHTLIDPIGFGFETYDPIGKFRTMDGANPIDASGEIVASEDANGPFSGAVALAKKLAGSRQVQACVVKQWFRYAHGRNDDPGDQAGVQQVKDAFSAAGFDMRELMVALTRTETFRSQLVEVSQ